MPEIRTLFPPGHFYSPICDPTELAQRENELWPASPADTADHSIDYNVQRQLQWLADVRTYAADIEFAVEQPDSPDRYFYANDQFPCLDAEVLFCMIRHLRPRAIVEVGSGYSTLVMAEVNRRFFDNGIRLTCVEPYPRQFLIDGVAGVSALIRSRVQAAPLEPFDDLASGDVLFIDSSHVAKTGSDVNYLFFRILPRLVPGVYVHIHDIFLPDEYPRKWAIEDGRNWNEQYLVRAFLQYNAAFEIVWGSYLMSTRRPAETAAVFPRFPKLGGGGSLWLRRRATKEERPAVSANA